ncbi:hypothetical protein HT594_00099 [Phenacoccus solenopsis nudivirus]|nr:hypothetical protein HT594_00099 [Phenacoccus solenopsis nudivirus]
MTVAVTYASRTTVNIDGKSPSLKPQKMLLKQRLTETIIRLKAF